VFVRTYVRIAIHFAPLFSFSSALSFLSLSVRLFLHFPGPLALEEDISFHSVIIGEPNLHNTRVARVPPFTFYFNRGNRSNLPRIPLARRNEAGADQPVEQSATETEGVWFGHFK